MKKIILIVPMIILSFSLMAQKTYVKTNLSKRCDWDGKSTTPFTNCKFSDEPTLLILNGNISFTHRTESLTSVYYIESFIEDPQPPYIFMANVISDVGNKYCFYQKLDEFIFYSADYNFISVFYIETVTRN